MNETEIWLFEKINKKLKNKQTTTKKPNKK